MEEPSEWLDVRKGRKKLTTPGNRNKAPKSSSPYRDYYNDAVIAAAVCAAANRKICDKYRSLDLQPLLTVLFHSSFINVGSKEGK